MSDDERAALLSLAGIPERTTPEQNAVELRRLLATNALPLLDKLKGYASDADRQTLEGVRATLEALWKRVNAELTPHEGMPS